MQRVVTATRTGRRLQTGGRRGSRKATFEDKGKQCTSFLAENKSTVRTYISLEESSGSYDGDNAYDNEGTEDDGLGGSTDDTCGTEGVQIWRVVGVTVGEDWRVFLRQRRE